MKSPHSFLVTPIDNKRYVNTKEIGGIDFIISTSEENHKASNRFATVVETPLGYKGEVKKGDTLLVHHNVFKFYNDMKGRRKSGKSFLMGNLFLVDPDQFYLYKRDGDWRVMGMNEYGRVEDFKGEFETLKIAKRIAEQWENKIPKEYAKGGMAEVCSKCGGEGEVEIKLRCKCENVGFDNVMKNIERLQHYDTCSPT